MRLTKIYTKVGDGGETYLASGQKTPKTSARIEAFGTVDELNAVFAILREHLKDLSENKTIALNLKQIEKIQNELFDLGGELSTPAEHLNIDRQQVVSEKSIARLESEIDQFNENLEPLENFVLPGGCKANAYAHLARTVCRRAERAVLRLNQEPNSNLRKETFRYLNRLSDWLFIVSRVYSKESGARENLWEQNKP